MANFAYTELTRMLANKELDLDTDSLHVLLVMTNTTADTERNATTIAGITTLDQFDGANYSSGGLALSGVALAADGTNFRTNLTASASSWSALGAGTRAIQGAVIVKWTGTLSTSTPLIWIDTGGFPITASGADLTITWNASGFLQIGPSA
jgi:hypothetical protein